MVSLSLYSQKSFVLKSNLEHFKSIILDCSMQYDLSMLYPDGKIIRSRGLTAISRTAYFDSSDRHYLFYNQNWYINANHDEKRIVVMNMNKVNEQLGGVASFSPFQFLFSSEDFFENLQFNTIGTLGDTLKLNIESSVYPEIQRFQIMINKKTMIPWRYNITLRIPISNFVDEEELDESIQGKYVTVESNCFAIEHPASPTYFNESKIVHTIGKKSVLKKFNSYLTYTSKK